MVAVHLKVIVQKQDTVNDIVVFKLFVTFRVSRRRREMYIGHTRLCVCVCVCVCVSVYPSPHSHTTAPRTRM